MAGDWLPVREDLEEDPAVIHIARKLKCSRREAVGHVIAVWRWFGRASRDGDAHGVTVADLDSLMGVTGLAAALASTPSSPWLVVAPDGHVQMPRFDVWMSQGAKQRLLTARRNQAMRRRNRDARVTELASPSCQVSVTTGEERRVELQQHPEPLAPGPLGKPRKVPATDHQAAVDFWCSEYKRTRKAEYAFRAARDGATVKALLQVAPLDVFRCRATALLEHPDPFYAGADLGTLRAHWNKLITPKPPTPSYMRPADPEPDGPKLTAEQRHAALRAAIDAANGRTPA